MTINDELPKAVKTVEDYVVRYYGAVRGDVANTSLVGSADAVADRIGAFLQKGLNTVIIGQANPDPQQLDLFGDRVLPQLKL
jgi:alkanesulfonate monooxygenase SsuD/methylene tetrahydromethanopterin reductase-like flavin-dependent oxidoreductase (luciferase family)